MWKAVLGGKIMIAMNARKLHSEKNIVDCFKWLTGASDKNLEPYAELLDLAHFELDQKSISFLHNPRASLSDSQAHLNLKRSSRNIKIHPRQFNSPPSLLWLRNLSLLISA